MLNTALSADIELSEYLIFLAQSCISLFGFVAIFFIFRYKSLDTYIDNRYQSLRSIFAKQIEANPGLDMLLVQIGSNRGIDTGPLFAQTDDPQVIDFFLEELRRLYLWRSDLKRRAMLTLFYLAFLTIAIILVWLLRSLLIKVGVPVYIITSTNAFLFICGLAATLNLLYHSFGMFFSRKNLKSKNSSRPATVLSKNILQ